MGEEVKCMYTQTVIAEKEMRCMMSSPFVMCRRVRALH